MITIETAIGQASMDDEGQWTATDTELLTICDQVGQLEDVPAHIAEPQRFAAHLVLGQAGGGTIVEYVPDLIALEDGAIE